MGWDIIVPLIIQYGLPAAEDIFQKWSAGKQVTQADFDNLRALEHITAADQLKSVLVSKGIPLTDPHAVALLALVS